MVQVKWRKAALKDLNTLLEKAYLEYGQHTMNNHLYLKIFKSVCKCIQIHTHQNHCLGESVEGIEVLICLDALRLFTIILPNPNVSMSFVFGICAETPICC